MPLKFVRRVYSILRVPNDRPGKKRRSKLLPRCRLDTIPSVKPDSPLLSTTYTESYDLMLGFCFTTKFMVFIPSIKPKCTICLSYLGRFFIISRRWAFAVPSASKMHIIMAAIRFNQVFISLLRYIMRQCHYSKTQILFRYSHIF